MISASHKARDCSFCQPLLTMVLQIIESVNKQLIYFMTYASEQMGNRMIAY